jgi:hypothetical protein
MIGIDSKEDDLKLVREFSCQICYRSWWRRVRSFKQVSTCVKCKKKYEPIPYEKEFGICEFKCNTCSQEFYKWCSKEGFIQCRNCQTICKPIKILINEQNLLNSTSNSCISIVNNNNNNNRKNNSFKYYCKYCSDTNINLSSPIVFRPQNSRIYDYLPINKNGPEFCSYCRRITYFSQNHISSGIYLILI